MRGGHLFFVHTIWSHLLITALSHLHYHLDCIPGLKAENKLCEIPRTHRNTYQCHWELELLPLMQTPQSCTESAVYPLHTGSLGPKEWALVPWTYGALIRTPCLEGKMEQWFLFTSFFLPLSCPQVQGGRCNSVYCTFKDLCKAQWKDCCIWSWSSNNAWLAYGRSVLTTLSSSFLTCKITIIIILLLTSGSQMKECTLTLS